MTRFLIVVAVAVAASGCGADSEADSSGTAAADTTQAGDQARPQNADDEGTGFFENALSFVLSNPRSDRSTSSRPECGNGTDYSGRSRPYHSIPIDNGNDFSTARESFPTSSPEAQTPYVAYATWDPCALYLGLAGSAVGAGDCQGQDCPLVDRPESPYRYWLVYLDTDPQGGKGTAQPSARGPAPDRLPIKADYLLEVRLDGVTTQTGDGYTYQGNSQLYNRTSDWSVGLEDSWSSVQRDAVTIGDNSSSNFLELSITREALGNPCAVDVVGWVVDTQADRAFAYWPPPRRGGRAPGDSTSTPRDSLVLDAWGFLLIADQIPNASGNLNRSDYSTVAGECGSPGPPQE